MIKALVYCRVSSQRQVDEGHGIDSQEQRCKMYAQAKDYDVVKVFPDEGVSGGLFDRPAMKDLIAYLDAYPLEKFIIIFDDLARFARDVKVHIQLKAELVSRGAKLECLNFSYDDSEESEMAELMLAVSNQYQRKANRRQVIQKMKARLERGYWPFMPPLGLVNKKDLVHGKILTPREPYASIFKKAIEKFRDGLFITPEEVKQYLHEEFKAKELPNRPSLSTVKKILQNPLYAGYIEYKDWGVPLRKAQHEGFISLETHNAVLERLQRRSKPWKRRDYSSDFPLRPNVFCNGCAKPMTASWNKGRTQKYPNYFCRAEGCIYRWKVVGKHKLESEFEQLLSSVKPADDIVDLTKDVLLEQWGIRLEQYVNQRRDIATAVDEATTAIDTYLGRIRKTKNEDLIRTYEEEITKLKKSKRENEQTLGKQIYSQEQFGTALDKVFGVIKQPLKMWRSDDFNNKRTIISMYFEDKLTYDYNSGFGTAILAYPISLITQNPPVTEGICGDVE